MLEARNNLSQLIARAAAGEDVVIAKRDVPVVRLVPVRVDVVHGRGDLIVQWLDDHPLPERLARDPELLDLDVADEREGWE
ncbi:type II toxin-antitoxin system prevent-host-death family antitoxin [Luteimicrobium sp. DT211]|uniref:type II toxin-antitoxin system prevent-host-death family antitoxin n=1 Tax=Luteimicrobium sp. DT211 TaxID=3393412 RepID=UPI003CF63E02